MRVPVLVLALVAMPIAVGAAQGRGKQQRIRAASVEDQCKQQFTDNLSRAADAGRADRRKARQARAAGYTRLR